MIKVVLPGHIIFTQLQVKYAKYCSRGCEERQSSLLDNQQCFGKYGKTTLLFSIFIKVVKIFYILQLNSFIH